MCVRIACQILPMLMDKQVQQCINETFKTAKSRLMAMQYKPEDNCQQLARPVL